MNMIKRFQPLFQKVLDFYFDISKTSGEVGDADFHVDLVVHIASILRPKCYVELGVYKGETFNRVSKFADEAFAVDINEKSSEYIKNKQSFYCGTTDSFLEYFKKSGKKIDLLFIDADHSADSVRFEFTEYFPFVTEQGVILMHDGYPLNEKHTDPKICGDGYKAINELSVASLDYEMVTVPFPPGLTICRKRKKQVPWMI